MPKAIGHHSRATHRRRALAAVTAIAFTLTDGSPSNGQAEAGHQYSLSVTSGSDSTDRATESLLRGLSGERFCNITQISGARATYKSPNVIERIEKGLGPIGPPGHGVDVSANDARTIASLICRNTSNFSEPFDDYPQVKSLSVDLVYLDSRRFSEIAAIYFIYLDRSKSNEIYFSSINSDIGHRINSDIDHRTNLIIYVGHFCSMNLPNSDTDSRISRYCRFHVITHPQR